MKLLEIILCTYFINLQILYFIEYILMRFIICSFKIGIISNNEQTHLIPGQLVEFYS